MITRLSHSAVDTYLQCGERFRLTRVVQVPQKPSWSLIGGSAVHTATAALDLKDFGVPSEDPDNFRDAFEAGIAEAKEKSPEIPESEWHRAGRVSKANPNKEDRKWWEESGPGFVQSWRDFILRSPWPIWIVPDDVPEIGGLPAIELELTGEIAGVTFKGYLDRILDADGKLGVVDLKSGRTIPSKAMQLEEYRLVLAETALGWANAPSWGSYFDCREAVLTPPVELGGEDVIEHLYREVWRGVEEGRYLPSPGPLCRSCPVSEYCIYDGGRKAAEALPWEAAA